MELLSRLADRIRPRLQVLYGCQAEDALSGILQVCARYTELPLRTQRPGWSQRDAILIAYADHVRSAREAPLATLGRVLVDGGWQHLFSTLHLLPFFPASSDDGFAVIDYQQVAPEFGTWADVHALREQFELMFDLVLNHTSRHCEWFQQYLRGADPYSRYFVELDSSQDASGVVRPRSTPVLTPFVTTRGRRYVWTTFSDDQVDLDYREPRVLVSMVDVLLAYLRHGARIVRLDAVAYLWKQLGTPCVNLPQTHLIVKLLRDVVDTLAPETWLLTETNMPHEENISYWGDSDEAHLVYNFSLPPLLLEALLTGDGEFLARWLGDTPAPPAGTTYLNFTASHDGIGVRPLESLLPPDRTARLLEAMEARGGLISQRTAHTGQSTPYEINISYFAALGDPAAANPDFQLRRFLASQAIMLSLRGIPAVYFPSLLGTPNDHESVARTGRQRSINRKKYSVAELHRWISREAPHRYIWNAYRRLLAVRRQQPAFHPDAAQQVLPTVNPAIVAFRRISLTTGQAMLVVANLSDQSQQIELPHDGGPVTGDELITGRTIDGSGNRLSLEPYQVLWLPASRRTHVLTETEVFPWQTSFRTG